MESIWTRVEYFPRIYIITDSRDPEWFAKAEHWTWKIPRSCQCSMILIGQEMETMRSVFRVQKNQDVCEEIFAGTLDVHRSWKRQEVVRKLRSFTDGKAKQGNRSPSLYKCHASAESRGILRTLKGKETIHFNADASNTERLFRIIPFCESAQYLRSSFE